MKKRLTILISVLLLSGFFGFYSMGRAVPLVVLVLLVVYGLCDREKGLFDKYILITLLGLCLSIASCHIFRDQPLSYTIVATVNYLEIAIYFFYTSKKFSSSDIYWALYYISIMVAVIYILNYLLFVSGINLIQYSEKYEGKGENVRFRMSCSAAVFFLYFTSLSNILKSINIKDVIFFILCIIIVLLMGFRSMILATFGGTLCLLYFEKIDTKKWIQISAIFFLLIMFVASNSLLNNKIETMIERHASENFSNDDYIRFKSLYYFQEMHFLNPVEHFLGSGCPDGHSKYSEEMTMLSSEFGIYAVDWGLLGMSWIVGVLTLVGVTLYCFSLFINSKNYPAIRAWILFLYFCSLLTYELPRSGNFVIQALVLSYVAKNIKEYDVKILFLLALLKYYFAIKTSDNRWKTTPITL